MSTPWENYPDAWWHIDGDGTVYSSREMEDADPEDGWYRANPPTRYDTNVPVPYSLLDDLLLRIHAEAQRANGAK